MREISPDLIRKLQAIPGTRVECVAEQTIGGDFIFTVPGEEELRFPALEMVTTLTSPILRALFTQAMGSMILNGLSEGIRKQLEEVK